MQSPDPYTDWSTSSEPQPAPNPSHRPSSPPLMSANVNGPVDPHEFYTSFSSASSGMQQDYIDIQAPTAATAASSPPRPMPGSFDGSSHGIRSYSQSPERARARTSSTNLGIPNQKLNTAKSQPALNARPAGLVKDMASKFQDANIDNMPQMPVRVPNEKYRRPLPSKIAAPSVQPTSPRAQRRKPVPSQTFSPNASFETDTSFSSAGTAISTQSQPATGQARRPPRSKEPLFGEITADGQWNANFDLIPDYFPAMRRGSESNVSSPLRQRAQNTLLHPQQGNETERDLMHKRSRSDMTEVRPSPTSPDAQDLFKHNRAQPPTPSSISTTTSASRIPVRGRRSSLDSPQSGSNTPISATALPSPVSRPRISRSSTQEKPKSPPEPQRPQSRRYNPPTLQQTSQLLSAKVVAPPPKVSPPLRSSRPRQPVSAATTAASRARAAQNSPLSPSGKRPSEQWLGKPYEPKEARPRRRIPELGKVDFAERRARIQKAISQNLEENEVARQLASRAASGTLRKPEQSSAGAEKEVENAVDQHQTEEFEKETADLGLDAEVASPSKSLKLTTSNLPAPNAETFLDTAGTDATDFSFDDRSSTNLAPPAVEHLQMLTPATYQAPSKTFLDIQDDTNDTSEKQSTSSQDSPSDIEDKWGLDRGLGHGSIKIMLAENPKLITVPAKRESVRPLETAVQTTPKAQQGTDPSTMTPLSFDESPVDPVLVPNANIHREDEFDASAENEDPHQTIADAIKQWRLTGTVDDEMVSELSRHTVDLHRLSANGGTDANIIQNLLESIMAQQSQYRQADQEIAPVTPHTPPGASAMTGTAVVFNGLDSLNEITPERRSQDAVVGSDDEDDFAAQIRRADAEWERAQRGDDIADEDRPQPPPKDEGYTPHSSIGPDSNINQEWNKSGQRLSIQKSDNQSGMSKNVDSVMSEEVVVPSAAPPSLPSHAPPRPPPGQESPSQLPSAQEATGHSPRNKGYLSGAGSSRPSVDSQRALPPQASQSMSSFADSTRQSSTEISSDANGKPPATPLTPEQKKLQKRRHIVRELLDTENTYHQDLKIIEDIYKATVSEIVTIEDRKVLFGNCDDIERFSLQFYDQLRKAASGSYTPARNRGGPNSRASMSTMQSDAVSQVSTTGSENIDEAKDKTTYIGKTFLNNLQKMEQLYGSYLKNHDAANQRLSALQSNPTVKCWLDECHNNASDITSAWDLDSLLVKPTQRVSKYPLLLQQLVEVTPESHPDYDSLKRAAKDTVAMLTRINDAKKRSDLVEQLISGKRKETDVRSGLAKAFGRRTERLKERVGINEAFQDPEFDALAQSFGGHYIRLQVTMRDFQDYVNQVDKAIQNTSNYAAGLELFTDVQQSSLPEIESKWRRYTQIIRDLVSVTLTSHKAAVQKRVIQPLITLIKLHEAPQRAINKRKKHIVDYAKCKSIEKRGERPDKKTIEASEMYEALNDALKFELPKLYDMTGRLVQACLGCFVDTQQEWHQTWQRKLEPLLETDDVPKKLKDIVPAFLADFELAKARLNELAVCNGAILSDSANFLAPMPDSDSLSKQTTTESSKTLVNGSPESSRRPSTTSDLPPDASRRTSTTYTPDLPPALETPSLPQESRFRSNSSMSHHNNTNAPTPVAPLTAANRPWSNSVTSPPASIYNSRPSTAGVQQNHHQSYMSSVRSSIDQNRRHDSTATYVTAQPDQTPDVDLSRISGLFNSAMPPTEPFDTPQTFTRTMSPTPAPAAPEDVKVLFCCASLYEFNIDKARKEAGYPYLTYGQGEIFDVIAQKGELWLAKNQDDSKDTVGWIWEQHFVMLTNE